MNKMRDVWMCIVCVYIRVYILIYTYTRIYIYICHMYNQQQENEVCPKMRYHWSQKIGPFVRSMHPFSAGLRMWVNSP